ncbi:MAG: nucleoid-associated protein EbfC [Streptomyces sp.]|nr:nucleoid-associated protein EbfC [Streptomyces sp.]
MTSSLGSHRPDMQEFLRHARQMQHDLVAAKEDLEQRRVYGSAGDGSVTATVDGTARLQGLTIAPEAADPNDTDTLAALVVAAIHNATTTARQMAKEEIVPTLSSSLAESVRANLNRLTDRG